MTIVVILARTDVDQHGKLADVELHFSESDAMPGTKLVGFSVWERRSSGGRIVILPSCLSDIPGQTSFSLLQPIRDARYIDALKTDIIRAFEAKGGR